MADTIKEFGQVLPDKRIAEIAGIRVDVSRVPARLTLKALKLKQRGNVTEDENIDLLVEICAVKTPEITRDFLLDNLDMAEIGELVKYINDPLTKKAEAELRSASSGTEGAAGKNG